MKKESVMTGMITLFTLTAAALQLFIGFQERSLLRFMDAAGYLILLSLLVAPVFQGRRKLLSFILLLYTLISFASYFILQPSIAGAYSRAGIVAPTATTDTPAGVVATDTQTTGLTSFTLDEQTEGQENASTEVLPLAVRGIEVLLIMMLLVDIGWRKKSEIGA